MHNLHYRAHFTTIEFSSAAAAASRSFSFSLARMILCCSMWAHAISGRRLPFRFIFFLLWFGRRCAVCVLPFSARHMYSEKLS